MSSFARDEYMLSAYCCTILSATKVLDDNKAGNLYEWIGNTTSVKYQNGRLVKIEIM